MKYSNNDLWSVRQIEFLDDALKGHRHKSAIYYPERKIQLSIPDIAEYKYLGVLHFPEHDRTIIFEQGKNYGLKKTEILKFLRDKNIKVEVRDD
ncbi:MAG: hypothetical protein WD877_02530 [Candidatus Saccharimonadales bacterium]